ncbi:MAG: hypothetical protein K2H82_09745 [Oscillospiraceae bacterium]|nr:hypothetical protein [Oscillospiraceae bacterium]
MINWFIIFILLAVVLGWLFSLSYILGFIFLILMLASVCSILFARPVIYVTIQADKLNSDIQITGGFKPVAIELDADSGYQKEIAFADFLRTDSVILSHGDQAHDRICYDRFGNVRIQVRRNLLQGVRCEILNETNGVNLSNYLRFSSSTAARHNKIMIACTTLAVILIAVMLCDVCNRKYHENKQAIQENLTQNINSVAQGESITLDVPEDPAYYYAELPDVHLLVITKPDNLFYAAEEKFCNPEIFNTVLLFYEDNLSGQRDQAFTESNSDSEPVSESETNPDISSDSVSKKYYNLTELYLNIPVQLEDPQLHTLGELFQGETSYQNQTGYQAVADFFRDQYHIRIASVTEIPESVISDCFGTEHAISVNLNQDFVRFLYDNYYLELENKYASFSIKEMLSEQKPEFSQAMRRNIKELQDRLEKNRTLNRMLIMDGNLFTAFGNTVRMTETSEYQFLRDKGYYQDMMNFPPVDWDAVRLDSIVHSNWDIVLSDLLESISNMNNSMYEIFCKENHTDLFRQIRTSLPPEQLESFLYALCKANDTLGDEITQQNQYVFYVRNLRLHQTTILGKSNVYLLNQPLEIAPYTNRQVKRALYYCLREQKET